MTAAEELLGIALPASTDEVKRAYRRQISRYHPDKVHHLGEEFQVLAAAKSAQLTEVYQRLMESNGSDAAAEALPTPAGTSDGSGVGPINRSRDESSSTARGTDATAAGAVPRHANRMSTWQAVAVGCPSLILTAAVDRLTQSVRWTLPRVEECTVAGFSLAWRTRADWRGLFRRRPSEGVLLRTPSDAVAAGRQRARIRNLLPGVEGAIVIFDLVVGPATEPYDPAGPRAAQSRPEPDVFAVTLDAMSWKAQVPPQAPEIVHLILARLRDSRV
jgi:DnaJ-like protein